MNYFQGTNTTSLLLRTTKAGRVDHTTVLDHDCSFRIVARAGRRVFNLLHDTHTVNHLPEDNMLAIQMRRRSDCKEELRAIGVGSRVGHAQETANIVLEREVLVVKFTAVDADASRSISPQKITTLTHESRDHAVERGSLVASLRKLPTTKTPEVL